MQWQVDHFQHIVSMQHHCKMKTAAAFFKRKTADTAVAGGPLPAQGESLAPLRAPYTLGNLLLRKWRVCSKVLAV